MKNCSPMLNNIAETIYSTNDWMNKRLAPIDFHRSIDMYRFVCLQSSPRGRAAAPPLSPRVPLARHRQLVYWFQTKNNALTQPSSRHDGCAVHLPKLWFDRATKHGISTTDHGNICSMQIHNAPRCPWLHRGRRYK